jgi:hypothetical protein
MPPQPPAAAIKCEERAVAKRVTSLDSSERAPKGVSRRARTEGGLAAVRRSPGRVSQRCTTGLRRGHGVGLDRGR